MTYLSWAATYEGVSDSSYFEVLLPRLLGEIVMAEGIRGVQIPDMAAVRLGAKSRRVEDVAQEICDNGAAFHLVFVHADTGGRNVARTLDSRSSAYCERANAICGWNPARCVTITPDRETEAWVLADPLAVMNALGFVGTADELGLPRTAAAAENLPDPKAVLTAAVQEATGRARSNGAEAIFATVAQTQSVAALRGARSFQRFEARLRTALATLGIIAVR